MGWSGPGKLKSFDYINRSVWPSPFVIGPHIIVLDLCGRWASLTRFSLFLFLKKNYSLIMYFFIYLFVKIWLEGHILVQQNMGHPISMNHYPWKLMWTHLRRLKNTCKWRKTPAAVKCRGIKRTRGS